MPQMDGKKILDMLNSGLEMLEKADPILDMLNVPILSQVSNVAQAVKAIAQQTVANVEQGRVVLESQDQEQIRAIIRRVQPLNDELARRVANS